MIQAAELKSKSLVVASYGTTMVIAAAITAFEEDNQIKVNREVESPGFYFIDGRIKAYHVNHPKPFTEDINKCINLLEMLVSKYKRREAFATVLNWSVVAPFDFAMKQIDGSWIPAIHAYGWAGTGKSTLGDIPCYI